QAVRLLEDYRKRMPEPPAADYYEVEDVCGRVSGISSMGRLRYVVLLAGKGTEDGRNVLLEFKESHPSAYDVSRHRQEDAAELNEVEAFRQRILAFGLAYADLAQRDWKRFVGHRTDLERCEEWAAALQPARAGPPT